MRSEKKSSGVSLLRLVLTFRLTESITESGFSFRKKVHVLSKQCLLLKVHMSAFRGGENVLKH